MNRNPVLITGASGFVGSNLVKLLHAHGYPLILLNHRKNINFTASSVVHEVFPSNCREMESLFKKYQLSGVIHLATEFSAGHDSDTVEKMLDANVSAGMRLLESAHKTSVPWFINAGTFWQHVDAKDYEPVNLYAATKQALETIAVYYKRVSGTKIVTLCLNDTYGRGDTRKKIFALWKELLSDETLSMDMSPGEQLMDILHIDDVCDGFLHLIGMLEQKKLTSNDGDLFYLTSGKLLKLRDVAAVFEQVSGSSLNINWGAKSYRDREVMTPACAGKPLPGWQSRISLAGGIAEFLGKY